MKREVTEFTENESTLGEKVLREKGPQVQSNSSITANPALKLGRIILDASMSVCPPPKYTNCPSYILSGSFNFRQLQYRTGCQTRMPFQCGPSIYKKSLNWRFGEILKLLYLFFNQPDLSSLWWCIKQLKHACISSFVMICETCMYFCDKYRKLLQR